MAVLLGALLAPVLIAVTVYAARRVLAGAPSTVAVLALGLLGLAWQQLDHPFEGAILWTVTPTHGLVVADLVALPALGLLIAQVLLTGAAQLTRIPRPAVRLASVST